MTQQAPSVGRVVHYVSEGSPVLPDGTQKYASKCRAAIVTEVRAEANENGQCVALCVLNPTGQFFNEHICQDEGAEGPDHGVLRNGAKITDISYAGGTWHWPERV